MIAGPSDAWTAELAPLLVKYQPASCSAILVSTLSDTSMMFYEADSTIQQVLYHSVLVLCPSSPPNHLPPPFIDILTKSCWAAVHLLQFTVNSGLNAPDFFLELCKCLCGLFVLLRDGDDQLKSK